MSIFPVASDSVTLDTAQVETTDVWANGFRINPVTGGVRAAFSNTVSTYNQGIPLDSNGAVCLVDSTASFPSATWSNGIPLSNQKVCLSSAASSTYSNGLPMAANGGVGGLLVPSMSLYFLGTASLDSRITFTRADAVTCATYFDSTGRMQTAAANVARFDYDPATLQPRGLLIEESRQNLLLQSRDMTQAAWTKTDVTPTRNQVGIDGVANTACLMTEGSAGTSALVQTGTVTAGATVSGSFILKRGNNDWFRVAFTDGLGNGALAWFNLSTGETGTLTTIGAATGTSRSITSLGGGWYRCVVIATPSGAYTTTKFEIQSAAANASGTRVSGATYIVDCAQLEVGGWASSIIPTTTTALTRAADSASMTGANFSSWFSATEGTFVAEADQPVAPPSGAYAIYGASDNTANNFIGHRFDTSGTGDSAVAITGGVNQTSLGGSGITVGSVVKVAHSYDATGRSASRNGGTVRTQAGYTLPTLTQLGIGNYPSSNTLNGHIRSLRFYPKRLSNSQIQALTS